MLGAVTPLGAETAALGEAQGRTLAAPVVAARAHPPFAASAMDGYALRASDTPGPLRIVGESAAGHAFARPLGANETVRISTGARMPAGADAVLVQEDARVDGDWLHSDSLPTGRHVRPAGIDMAADQEVLAAGRRLDPVALALAAAAGAARVEVRRRPRVTILVAGDEITPPGSTPRDDQVFESCSWAIAGFARAWGAVPVVCPPLPDIRQRIVDAAARAIEDSDLVIFIGSASVGPHDHARAAFESLGAELRVRKVDMRPGKPTWFATTSASPVLGLPGNPASAIVAAILFLRPLLECMQGKNGALPVRVARLATPLPANGPRETFLRGRMVHEAAETWVDPSAEQDSSLLTVFAGANVLLIRSPDAPVATRGDTAAFVPIFDHAS